MKVASTEKHLDAAHLVSESLGALRDRALDAMANAYAPYSKFRVGAALLTADGTMVSGCNVESASFPAGVCAERVALGAAVTGGQRELLALAVATEAEEPTPPCGVCRQALVEFGTDLVILSVTRGGREARWTLDELLPAAFTLKALGQTRR